VGLDGRRLTGAVFRGERRACVGRLPASFFAEADEFPFVEAFVVFLEDLLGPGQILILYEYVASAAERSPRTSRATHTGNASVR
jgi:hypothetical protein